MNNIWGSPSGNVYTSGSGVEKWDGQSWEKLFDERTYGFAATSQENIFACGPDVLSGIRHLYHYNGVDWQLIKEVA